MHWKERVKDHASLDWMILRRMLGAPEQSTTRISKAKLKQLQFSPANSVSGWDVSMNLWHVMSRILTNTMYERRVRIVENDKPNGLGVWRRLYT